MMKKKKPLILTTLSWAGRILRGLLLFPILLAIALALYLTREKGTHK